MKKLLLLLLVCGLFTFSSCGGGGGGEATEGAETEQMEGTTTDDTMGEMPAEEAPAEMGADSAAAGGEEGMEGEAPAEGGH